jgi:hypothetical protein
MILNRPFMKMRLFNTLNLGSFNVDSASTRIDNPDLGRATEALGRRIVEFQVRFSF